MTEVLTLKNILIYIVVINIIAFLTMGYDKHEAKVGHWRISEKALFTLALIGGSVGAMLGMYTFRHKTKKWYFKYGFPIILVLQIIGIIYLINMQPVVG